MNNNDGASSIKDFSDFVGESNYYLWIKISFLQAVTSPCPVIVKCMAFVTLLEKCVYVSDMRV